MEAILRMILDGSITADELGFLAEKRDIFVDINDGRITKVYHRNECIWEGYR